MQSLSCVVTWAGCGPPRVRGVWRCLRCARCVEMTAVCEVRVEMYCGVRGVWRCIAVCAIEFARCAEVYCDDGQERAYLHKPVHHDAHSGPHHSSHARVCEHVAALGRVLLCFREQERHGALDALSTPLILLPCVPLP